MEFHAKEQLPGLLDWMRQQMKACGGKTAVIGISGGKDSSVVAALAVAAYGKENVVGVLMPDGIQPDIDYSNGLVEFLGIRHYVFNIQGGTAQFSKSIRRRLKGNYAVLPQLKAEYSRAGPLLPHSMRGGKKCARRTARRE